MSAFSLPDFYQFCNALRIDSKELGSITLGKTLLGSQRRLINEIAEGLNRGVHEFVVLKARQLGISTVCLALDLYFAAKFHGMSGALITHDEPAREQFRTTLQLYYQSLPTSRKRRIRSNNRNQLVFQHGTRFMYKVAGTKTKASATLGRSAALSYLHATECAFWGNKEDIDSLVATLAQENPNRFYLWESTANGFNHFYDMWMSAKESVTKKSIFIGWWTNELYRARRDSDVYQIYWGKAGAMTQAEALSVKEVRDLYGFDIDDEQLAWARWYMQEKCDGEELTFWAEMPATEYQAFVATGSQFFTAHAIGSAYRAIHKDSAPRYCRFEMGAAFADTRIVSATGKTATLKIFCPPEPGAHYVLGADPAYGSSQKSDRYAISVWRGYADRCDQVAEFCMTETTTAYFAWVMIYLAAWYEPCLWNLEVNGPGQGVLTELQNMSKSRVYGASTNRKALTDAMKQISTYLYKRYDSLYRTPTAIHTVSTMLTKERYLNGYKDYFERGFLTVRSRDLIDEMKGLVREDGSLPEASGRSKDDRVIAAALAVIAWNDQLRTRLLMTDQTVAKVAERGAARYPAKPTESIVANMFRKIGFTEAVQKSEVRGVHAGVGK